MRRGHWFATYADDKLRSMIRRFSSSLAAALVALCCAQTAAPALAKDKPADAKSPAKPDAGKTVADKPNPKKA
jgi:hypothetical protein